MDDCGFGAPANGKPPALLHNWLSDRLEAERRAIHSALKARHALLLDELTDLTSALDPVRASRDLGLEPPRSLAQPLKASHEREVRLQREALRAAGALGEPAPESSVAGLKVSAPPEAETLSERPGKGVRHLAAEWVKGTCFESTFSALILLNTIVICLEYQYAGLTVGRELQLGPSGPESWPVAATAFEISEFAFGVAFTIELFLKLATMRKQFFKDPWNYMDAIVVLFWFMSSLDTLSLPLDPLIVRTFRLAKLLRLVRLAKTIKAFDALYLLTASIKSSLSALIWSAALILVAQVLTALCLSIFLLPYCLDDSNPLEDRLEVYRYFGTFTKAMLSMFELTLGNWIPITRVLTEKVSEWYTIFSLLFQIILGFSVIKVITGVFLTETMKVASFDDSIMLRTKERALKFHEDKMRRLFDVADQDRSGFIDAKEFASMISNQDVRKWLASMDFEVHTREQESALFEILDDDGDGQISLEELVRGIARMRGPARTIELHMFCLDLQKTQHRLEQAFLERSFCSSRLFQGHKSSEPT